MHYKRVSNKKGSVEDRTIENTPQPFFGFSDDEGEFETYYETAEPFLGFSDDKSEIKAYYNRFQKVRKSYLSPRVVLERINHSHGGRVSKKINNVKVQHTKLRKAFRIAVEETETKHVHTDLCGKPAEVESQLLGLDEPEKKNMNQERCTFKAVSDSVAVFPVDADAEEKCARRGEIHHDKEKTARSPRRPKCPDSQSSGKAPECAPDIEKHSVPDKKIRTRLSMKCQIPLGSIVEEEGHLDSCPSISGSLLQEKPKTEPMRGRQKWSNQATLKDQLCSYDWSGNGECDGSIAVDPDLNDSAGLIANKSHDTVLESELDCKRPQSPAFLQNDSDVDVESDFLDFDVSQKLREVPERCACHGETECSGSDMDICNSPLTVPNVVVADENSRVLSPNFYATDLETPQANVLPPFDYSSVSPSLESFGSAKPDDGIGKDGSRLWSSKKSSGGALEGSMTSLKPCVVKLERVPEIEKLLQQKVTHDVEAVTQIDLSDGFALRKFCELESIVLTDSSSDEENEGMDSRKLLGPLNQPYIEIDLTSPTEMLDELDPEVVSENPVPSGMEALNELGFLEHESFTFGKDPPSDSWNDLLDFGEAMGIAAAPKRNVKSNRITRSDGECVKKGESKCDEWEEKEKPRLKKGKTIPTESVGDSEFLTSLIRPASPHKESRKNWRKGNVAKKRKHAFLEPLDVGKYEKAQNASGDSKRRKPIPRRDLKSMEDAEKDSNGRPPAPKHKVLKLPSKKQCLRENPVDGEVEAKRISREQAYKLTTSWMMTKVIGMEDKNYGSEEKIPTTETLFSDLATIPYIVKCHLQNRNRHCKDVYPCANANKKFKLYFSLTVGAGRKLSRHLLEKLRDAEDTCKINRTTAFIAASAVMPHPTTILVPADPDVVQNLIPTYHATLLMELVAKTLELEKQEKKTVSEMNLAETLQFKRALIAIKSRFQKGSPQSVPESPIILHSLQPGNPYVYKSNQIVATKSKVDSKIKFVKKPFVSILSKDANKRVCEQTEDENECPDSTENRLIGSPGDQVSHVSGVSPSKGSSSSDVTPNVSKKMPVILSDRSAKPLFKSLLRQRDCKKTKNVSSPESQVAFMMKDDEQNDSEEATRKVPQILEAFSLSGNGSDNIGVRSADATSSGCSIDVSSIKSEDVADSDSSSLRMSSSDPERFSFGRNDTRLKPSENQLRCRNPNASQSSIEEDVILVPEKYNSIDLTAGEDEPSGNSLPDLAAICTTLPELGFVRVQKAADKLLIYDQAVVTSAIELSGLEELGRFLNARLADRTFPQRKKVTLDWILVTSGYLILKAIPHTNPLFWLPPHTARNTLMDIRHVIRRYGLNRAKVQTAKKGQDKFGNESVVKKTFKFTSTQRQFKNVGKIVRINGQSVVMGTPANFNKQQCDVPVVRSNGKSVVVGTLVNQRKQLGDVPVVRSSGQSLVVGTLGSHSKQQGDMRIVRIINGQPVVMDSAANTNKPQITAPSSSGSTERAIVSESSPSNSATASTPQSVPVTRSNSGPHTHLMYTKASAGYVPLVGTNESTVVQSKWPGASTTSAGNPKKKNLAKSAASVQSLPCVPNQQIATAPRPVPITRIATSLPASFAMTSSQPVTVNSVVSCSSAPHKATIITGSPTSAVFQQVPRVNTMYTTIRPSQPPPLVVCPAPRNLTPAASSASSLPNVGKPYKQIVVRPGCVQYATLASSKAGFVPDETNQSFRKISPAAAAVSQVSGVLSMKQSSVATTQTATVPSILKPLVSTAPSQILAGALSQKLGSLNQIGSSPSKHRPILILRRGTSDSIRKGSPIKFVFQNNKKQQ